MSDAHTEHEALVATLKDPEQRHAYAAPYDSYRAGIIARFFGSILIGCGNLVYGKQPSYQKFRAIEVIARVPYHSWASAIFTLLTLFYADEKRALRLSTVARFTRFAADNETMHVVVVSALARAHGRTGFVRHLLVPVLFAFVYFWLSYLLYILHPRSALELNYLFEQHAFDQYSVFLEKHEAELRSCPIMSDYLSWYGREARSEYEFFESVRNDELIHRNRSIHEIGLHRKHARA